MVLFKEWERHSDHYQRQMIIRIFVSVMAASLVAFHAAVFILNLNPLEASNPLLLLRSLASKSSYYRQKPTDKVVLLWTDFFSNPKWTDHFAANKGPFVTLPADKRCLFTTDRSIISTADAVVFHGRDIKFEDLPQPPIARNFNSKWIFYLLESPRHSGFATPMEWDFLKSKMTFNWTMGYTERADVYSPYGQIRQGPPRDQNFSSGKVEDFARTFWQRPKDAVWIVSNCWSFSHREAIITKLKAVNISIDIWGRCGDSGLPDETWRIKGERDFFSQYRFYLAFENALCDNYVTEKAFHAFYASFLSGTIPILYGKGHGKFFPNGSYIDASTFGNEISNLADVMKTLSQVAAKENVTNFYEWQNTMNPVYEQGYELQPDSDIYIYDNYKRQGWHNLCEKLWQTPAGDVSVVEDVKATLGECHAPTVSDTPLGFQ